MEFGIRPCTKADLQKIRPHIPPEYRKYIKDKCTVEVSENKGMGAYTGYDEVIQIYYEFNCGASFTKVFPTVISKFSDKLNKLIQVSVLIHYEFTT